MILRNAANRSHQSDPLNTAQVALSKRYTHWWVQRVFYASTISFITPKQRLYLRFSLIQQPPFMQTQCKANWAVETAFFFSSIRRLSDAYTAQKTSGKNVQQFMHTKLYPCSGYMPSAGNTL